MILKDIDTSYEKQNLTELPPVRFKKWMALLIFLIVVVIWTIYQVISAIAKDRDPAFSNLGIGLIGSIFGLITVMIIHLITFPLARYKALFRDVLNTSYKAAIFDIWKDKINRFNFIMGIGLSLGYLLAGISNDREFNPLAILFGLGLYFWLFISLVIVIFKLVKGSEKGYYFSFITQLVLVTVVLLIAIPTINYIKSLNLNFD